jgi:hypothetical protein
MEPNLGYAIKAYKKAECTRLNRQLAPSVRPVRKTKTISQRPFAINSTASLQITADSSLEKSSQMAVQNE